MRRFDRHPIHERLHAIVRAALERRRRRPRSIATANVNSMNYFEVERFTCAARRDVLPG